MRLLVGNFIKLQKTALLIASCCCSTLALSCSATEQRGEYCPLNLKQQSCSCNDAVYIHKDSRELHGARASLMQRAQTKRKSRWRRLHQSNSFARSISNSMVVCVCVDLYCLCMLLCAVQPSLQPRHTHTKRPAANVCYVSFCTSML
jgi:hypothetical protein